MLDRSPEGAAAALKRAYRAVVPVGLRRSVRAGLARVVPGMARAPRPKRDPGMRRFLLPLPRPAATATPARRHGRLLIEAPRRLIVAAMLDRGGVAIYEPATSAVMLGVAEHLRPDVAFDVGANIGPNSLLIPALLGVPVVAFEPATDVAAALRHVAEVNGLQCTVVEAAVGEREDAATLFISPKDTSTSLRAGFRDASGEVSVPVLSLDSYIRATGPWPSLVKIDTETTEPAVLRGASELLARRPWIVCEVLPGWTEVEIESLLLPLGYLAFQIVDTWPLPHRTGIAGHASLENANWLFAPEAPTDELWRRIEGWRRAIDATEPPRKKSAASGR